MIYKEKHVMKKSSVLLIIFIILISISSCSNKRQEDLIYYVNQLAEIADDEQHDYRNSINQDNIA